MEEILKKIEEKIDKQLFVKNCSKAAGSQSIAYGLLAIAYAIMNENKEINYEPKRN